MTSVKTEKDEAFLKWLTENGAIIDKINWPCETSLGRGAIATVDIEPNMPMFEIPINIMMGPIQAFADPDIGEILQQSQDLLRGDLLLTVYLMHECTKKENSFYYPYIAILPNTDNLPEWNEQEIEEIQDEHLIFRAKHHATFLKDNYLRVFTKLNLRHLCKFDMNVYTYELFKFCWNTIQARAFGRRLEWTALVPFADCLNHNNVQTKYDYNVDENGMFRLFPSGTNSYAAGTQAFNSYGRRANENLLLDYGFSMMNNEWDEVLVPLSLTDEQQQHIRERFRYTYVSRVAFACRGLPFHAIPMFRALSPYTEKEVCNQDLERPISLENECETLEQIISIAQDFIDKQPTTIEEDEIALNALNVGTTNAPNIDRLRSALTYRITRKRILNHTILKLRSVIEVIRNDESTESDYFDLEQYIIELDSIWLSQHKKTTVDSRVKAYLQELRNRQMELVVGLKEMELK